MFKKAIITGAIASTLMLTGCASGLNSMQSREYGSWEQSGVLVEEKNPAAGAFFGVLPGGGSFYAREPALGVVNLLFWPASVLWDPVSGYEGAKAINYDATKAFLKKEENKELSALDDKLALGELTNKEYVAEKNKVDNKYSF